MKQAFQNDQFLKAYAYKYNMMKEDVDQIRNQNDGQLSASVFEDFYKDGNEEYSPLTGNLSNLYDRLN